MDEQALVERALAATKTVREAVDSGQLNRLVGCVGSALQTDHGQIFTGINLDFYCSIGFCAEHSAISDMLKHGQSLIEQIVAVTFEGVIIPPCGRCRELIYQVNTANLDTRVITAENAVYTLKELLPQRWQEQFDATKI